jgi:hypothetical protein
VHIEQKEWTRRQLEKLLAGPAKSRALFAIEAGALECGEVQSWLDTLQVAEGSEIDFTGNGGALALAYFEEKYAAANLARRQKRGERVAGKAERRATYLPMADVELAVRKDKTAMARYKAGLEAQGLMAAYLGWAGKPTVRPVSVRLLNRMVGEDEKKIAVPENVLDIFPATSGYQVFQSDKLWDLENPEVAAVFAACLPKAIEAGGYHRRLGAPLVPHGFLPALKARVGHAGVEGRHLGVDGSGWYDPAHPDFSLLMEEYGPVGFQFTAFNPEGGEFFKGILVPREDLNANRSAEEARAVQFDWAQCKGRHAAAYKTHAKRGHPGLEVEVHLGIIKAKTSRGSVSGCFETLENINSVKVEDKRRIAALVTSLTKEAVDRIGSLGPNGLIARAVRSDPTLRRLVEFVVSANALGANIDPLSIDALRDVVGSSLARVMWGPANGAGIRGDYPMVVLDNTIEQGTCVVSGYKPGTTLACWRYPTVLAQGLLRLTVVRPKPHMMVGGELIQNLIWMNPADITTRQQGDDDGDEVGVSADPRVVELFGFLNDRTVCHIEPASEKLPFDTLSEEGLSWLKKDPMGPVGIFTVFRASLLAAGDIAGARAMSVAIQEAIDSQKRFVRWTSLYRAVELGNWFRDRNGEYHIHYRCKGGECLCPEREGNQACPFAGQARTANWLAKEAGACPMEHIQAFYHQRMVATGAGTVVKEKPRAGRVLGWRAGGKAISVFNWAPVGAEQDFPECRNVVHYAYEVARKRWAKHQESFLPTGTIPGRELLDTILQRLGSHIKPNKSLTWAEYANGLRVKAGFEAWGEALKEARDLPQQVRVTRIDAARSVLEENLSACSAEELATIWWMEHTPQWWYGQKGGRVYIPHPKMAPNKEKVYEANKPSNGYLAVACKSSALMAALGMQVTETCSWATKEDRTPRFAAWAKAQARPYEALSKFLVENTSHGTVRDANGQAVHLADCPECTERFVTGLVRTIRADHAKELEGLKGAVTAFNDATRGTESVEHAKAELGTEWDTEGWGIYEVTLL